MYFAKVNLMTSKSVIVACLSGLLFLSGCSRTNRPADVEYDHSVSPYHRVGKGESISSIAQRFGMDKMELVRLNGLKPPYKIFVGQKLLVKTSATSAKPAGDAFDTPAASMSEMKGDVEVTALEPIKGTEPSSNNQLLAEPAKDDVADESTVDNDVDADIEGNDSEKPIAAQRSKVSIPDSAGSYRWPVKGKVIKGFKTGKNGNDGINISAPKGTPVAAANNGVVAHAGNQVAGLGNMILIKHANGYMTIYTHLNDIKVKKGQQVSAGDKIGTVGKTGNVKEPQLHFEIRNGKTPIDPSQHLN